jgi:glycosyltransferase involved in cell wall biosynthesis
MAMETPVVASQRGGPAEIIDSGTDGVLLPPRDAAAWEREVTRLLATPDLRVEMGALGRVKVSERFSATTHAEKVVEAYDVALNRTRETAVDHSYGV